MRERLSLGVIGCGRVAQAQHLRVLSALPGVHLAALADAHEGSLNTAAKRFAPDASRHTSYQAMLERTDLQAVVICLPTALHAEAAIASFEAGKAVYLEKPIGVDTAEARAVMQACEASGVPAQMGFNYRYHPAYAALRDALKAGRIGTVAAATSVFCSPPRELQGWKAARATGGGVLLDLFVHHADLAAFLLDQPIASVFATTRSVRTEDDTASIVMTTAQGLSIQTTVSAAAAQADAFVFTGDKGTLRAGRFGCMRPQAGPLKRSFAMKDRLAAGLGEVIGLPLRVAQAVRPAPEPSYQLSLAAFVDAVREGGTPQPGLEAGLRASHIVEAAEQSARTGKAVHLRDEASAPTTQDADAAQGVSG